MTGTDYVFDNAAASAARQRFTSLETLYDPVTCRNLETIGIGAGWECLEVGAGGGSVARWMAGQGGRVLAIDLDPSLCDPGSSGMVRVEQHDITTGPPGGGFDLIHARLVLFHLPQRLEVLRWLVAALTPGGWLAIEDFDLRLAGPVLGDSPAERLVSKYWEALCQVFTTRGAAPSYARTLPRLLAGAGLTGVHTEGHLTFSAGGTTGADLQRVNAEQTAGLLTGTGLITTAEIGQLREVFTDPDVTFLQPVMVTARGQAGAANV